MYYILWVLFLMCFNVVESLMTKRLLKKTEDGKYRCFITMLKQHSIIVPLIDTLEKMPIYAKFMKNMDTNKRSLIFEDDDRIQHCSVIAIRSLMYKKEDS